MTLADAKVIAADLAVFDHKKGREARLLAGLAEWCLRYTPLIMLDPPDGLLILISLEAKEQGFQNAKTVGKGWGKLLQFIWLTADLHLKKP